MFYSFCIEWFLVLLFIEHFYHCYNQLMKIKHSCFNCRCILEVSWTILKKRIYAWWDAWVFKARRFFVKAFKIVYIKKIIQRAMSFDSKLRSPKISMGKLWHRCFPVKFAKLLTSFFIKHLYWLLLTGKTNYVVNRIQLCVCIHNSNILSRLDLYLTLSWRKPLSYRNQSIDLFRKSMDWFLYDIDLRHERVEPPWSQFHEKPEKLLVGIITWQISFSHHHRFKHCAKQNNFT